MQRCLLDEGQEAPELFEIEVAAAVALGLEAPQLQPGAVDAFPHLRCERGAHGARIGAREIDAVADRGGVRGIEHQKLDDILLSHLVLFEMEGVGGSGGFERALPFAAGAAVSARQGRKPLRGVDDAGEIVGALQIAGGPVEIVGGAREHLVSCQPSWP